VAILLLRADVVEHGTPHLGLLVLVAVIFLIVAAAGVSSGTTSLGYRTVRRAEDSTLFWTAIGIDVAFAIALIVIGASQLAHA